MSTIRTHIRLTLDLNVFVADIRARQIGIGVTACTYLVNTVLNGRSEAGPVQLILSVPMIENFKSVLQQKFGYSEIDAEQRCQILGDIMLDGPMPIPPILVLESGIAPLETGLEYDESLENFRQRNQPNKLFHETQDDRYVLEAALAGGADILVTLNLLDFNGGNAIAFDRDDVLLYQTASTSLVIAKPAFVAHWMRQGIVPNADFLAKNAADFKPK